MKIERFDEFPNLSMLEWEKEYNDININHLVNEMFDESESIVKFVSAAAGETNDSGVMPPSEINWDSLLTARADGGVLVAVYGPSIWRDGDNIILKTGNNKFSLNVLGGTKPSFVCGDLIGELTGETYSFVSGTGATVTIQKPVVRFTITGDDEGDEFIIPVQTIYQKDAIAQGLIGNNEYVDYPLLLTLLKKKQLITHFLSSVPGGGYKKLSELEKTEYTLLGFEQQVGQYGVSFKLRLGDGIVAMSNKAITNLLISRGDMIQNHISTHGCATLKIAEITKLNNGKMSATATILMRKPFDTNVSTDNTALAVPERIKVGLPAGVIKAVKAESTLVGDDAIAVKAAVAELIPL